VRSFISLFRLYVATTYQPGAILAWFKQGPKGVAKALGAAVLALYVIAAFSAFLLLSSYQTYAALEPLGLEAVVLQNGVVTATAITVILGFITCLTTYFMSGAESFLLSLPLSPRALFGSKLGLVYLSEAVMAFLLVAVSTGVYAYFEHPGPLFYAYALLIAAFTPLLPLAAFYAVLVPLMTTVRFLRRKDAVMVIGGVLGIGLAIGWQIFYQKMMRSASDPQWIMDNLANPNSILARFGAAYPPAGWAAGALSGYASGIGALKLLAFLGLQVAVIAAAVLVLSGPYARSLTSFDETVVVRLKDSGSFIKAGFSRRTLFAASLKREMLIMLREPTYLLNGPFAIVLMPLVFGAMYLSMKDEFLKDLPFLADGSAVGVMAIAAMGLSAFLGGMTSIACTSISREGQQFRFLKSLPMGSLPYLGAKLVHGLLYAAFAAVIGPVLVSFISPLGWGRATLAGLAGFGISSLLNVIGLALDTLNPKLDWPNPTAAMKQNPNALVMAFACMGAAGGMIALGIWRQDWPAFLPLVAVGGMALAALGFIAYLPWANKRLADIE
jgi:ABC-2 type transport system permease protein